jgi:hypothetical protein
MRQKILQKKQLFESKVCELLPFYRLNAKNTKGFVSRWINRKEEDTCQDQESENCCPVRQTRSCIRTTAGGF